MAYENLCMYCFEEMDGQPICPHCGRDSRAAVPQIQMLPGTLVYHDRFLIGRALGQDATGIVYAAFDTKKENRLRIREYLPRDCAERLNDGAVVPIAGKEDAFEAGIRKLRASVESVEDPRKRHFFFEENGTAYIAQRKSASAAASRESEPEEEEGTGNTRRILMFAAIAVAVLLVAAVLLITVFNGAMPSSRDVAQSPTLDPSQIWIPSTTPTPTPYVSPTFAALVDPELSWMDYTYEGDVEEEFQQARRASATATPTPKATAQAGGSARYTLINGYSSTTEIRGLQRKLSEMGWLDSDQISGQYDAATRQAVRDLQSYVNEHYAPKQKLDVDGIAGPKTLQWLYEADAVKPTATPKPKVTPRADADTVEEGSSARQVRQVQQKLVTLGLLPESAVDGSYGATTAAAVRRFQTRVNQLAGYEVLEVSGRMDAQSLAFLDYYAEEWENLRKATAEPTAKPKATAKPTATPTTRPVEILEGVIDGNAPREKIIEVQQLLVDIGMLPKRGVDGVYGSATISAVADFQQWVNAQRGEQTLTVNGEVDQLTLLYLQYCKDHGLMPYATAAPKATATAKPTAAPTAEPLEPVEEEEETEDPQEGSQEIEIDEDSETESIRYVQEMLSAVGAMDASGVDGVYGKGTVRAVRAFQRWVNRVQGEGTLEVTGRVDNRTRLALEYAYDHELTVEAEEDITPEPTEAPTPEPTAQPLKPEAPTEAPTAQPLLPREEDDEEEDEDPEDSGEIEIDESSETESIRFVQEMLNAAGLLDADDVTGVYDSATTEAVRAFQRWVNRARGEEVLSVTGRIDDLTRQALEYAYDHDLTAGGEAQPEAEESEEPEVETPEVGRVSSPRIAFDGTVADGGVIEVSEGKVDVRWQAEGDVESYYVRVEDGDGNDIVSKGNTTDTRFTIDTDKMVPGETYTLRLGVMPVGGGEQDILWSTARFTLPAEPIEEEPEALEPEEVPEEEPRSEVGTVSAPNITVAGSSGGSGVVIVEDENFQIRWSAEGDVETYYVKVTDSGGSNMVEPQYTTQTSVKMRAVNLDEGEVYTLSVGVVPVGGTADDMVTGSVRFMKPVRTPEPTEEPTPEPRVASVGKPVVTVGGSAYQEGGVSYMTGSSIIVSWNADGDVESYTVYVENQSGERQELGSTHDTSRTVNTRSLPAGVYTVYVGAMPEGGDEDDMVWGSTRFGIPAPEEPEEEEPEDEPEEAFDDEDEEPEAREPDETEEEDPEVYDDEEAPDEEEDTAEAMAISGPISGSSDPDAVQQLQLRLYSLGLLSPDGLEPGILDTTTLQAVADFQTRMNEQSDAGFDVIDPGDLSAVIDAATVSAIFAG